MPFGLLLSPTTTHSYFDRGGISSMVVRWIRFLSSVFLIRTYIIMVERSSVADPYHIDSDPDPGCEKFVTDPDPGKNDPDPAKKY